MARTMCGMSAISRANNPTRTINLPLKELLVLLMMLCLCGCNPPDHGDSGMHGAEMGEPCRDIPFDKADDDGYIFMFPLPTPVDRSLPHLSLQVPPQGTPRCLQEQCHHGFTASFNVTVDIETVFKGDDVIDFAPRFGNAPDGDVVDNDWEMPLTLRMEDVNAMHNTGNFKVRMMTNDLIWNVEFRSRLGHPMLVGVTWRQDIGLDVYVDGICAGFVEVPHRRNIPGDDEKELKGDVSSILVTSFQFIDFLRPIESLIDLESEDTLTTYYLGCMDDIHTPRGLFEDAMTFPQNGIIAACRRSCNMAPSLYAFVNKDQCICGDDILYLDPTHSCGRVCEGYRSLPCGSRDKWGVYLTSGLITLAHHLTYENIFGMDLQPDGVGAPVVPPPPYEGRGRYKRSTMEEEDTQQHHVRHRRSAEFIDVDDVEGLVNTVLNITYVIQTDVTSLSCEWIIGSISTLNQPDAEHGTQFQYESSQAGVFTVNVNCDGIQDSATVTVRSSIQGTEYTIQQYGSTTTLTDVTLRVTRTTGSVWPINALFILNEQETPFVQSPSNVFDTTWTPTSFGIFQLDPVISNRFEDDISLSLNVTVGEPISGLTVRSSGSLGTYLPIQIIVEISRGSNVTVDIDFGNGNSVPPHILMDNEHTWIQSYMAPGTKEITVTASNVFGTESTNTSIDVPQSVTGLQMFVSPNVVSANESINVQLTSEAYVIPNVTCTIMTGDGREFIENNIQLDSDFNFSVTFNYSQDFHDAVKISATCSNAFSNQTVEKNVVVGREVHCCSILTPDAQRVGDNKETVISVQGGDYIQLQVDFGDGSTVVQTSSDFPGRIAVNHSFSSAGIYNVTATVSNAATSDIDCLAENTTIIVQENVPPENLFTLSATPNAIDLTTDNQINFTLTMDSGQSIRGDTYITFLFSQHCTCSLSIKLDNHAIQTGAIYNTSGTYVVTAIISNRVSAVVKKIQVGAMYQMDDFTVTPPELALLVGELVEFTVLPLNGTEIRINITWADGSHDFTYLESPIAVTFNHTYNVPGDYEVCVEALNGLSVSPTPECTTIQILNPVQGLDFGITNPLVLDDSSQFVIGLQPEIPLPSHMTCIIDQGDGTTPLTVSEGDLSTFPTMVPYSYIPAVKNYQATMHCYNVLGSSNHTLSVHVRKPIPEVFELQVTEPFYFLFEALVEYTLSVKNTEEDIPVGYAYFDWEFGDGNTSRTHNVMEDRTVVKRYRFTDEGLYMTKLTITYGSWSGLLTVPLVVAEERSLDVVVEYADDGQRGDGPNETWFYEDRLLRFEPEPIRNDTIYTWKYSTDQPPSIVTEFDHRFETTGVFAVQVNATYPLYSANFVTFVHIVSAFNFQGIEVVDSGNENLKLKAYSKLNITLTGTGLNSPLCILWMFCNETLYFSGPPNCYNAPYNSGEPGIAWTTEGQLLTHVEFNTPGIFNLTVIVTNNMESDDSAVSLLKTITIVGCTGPPEVTLRGSGRTRENPRKYLRSEQINLASTVRLRCFGLEETPQFQWSTILLEPFEPNATSVDLNANNLPDYTFPSLTFAVGLYNLTIKVTVTETSPPLSGIDSVFMHIDRTQLIVTIGGGSARAVNGVEDIQFDASESSDPDETLDDQDLNQWNFTWSCYRVETDASPRPTVDSVRSICEYSSEHTIPGEILPVFTIEALRLALDAKYIIKVTAIHSDGRSDSYEQAISTVPGEPVLARIDCVQNCLTKVNPTSQVAYQARCVNCRTQNATYGWEMTIGKETREEGNLATKAATELSKSGLVIRANVLEGGEFYYVRVYVEEPGMIRGFTEVSFYTNLAPYDGYCDIAPRSGSALLTDFTVTCDGWKDEGDGPQRPGPDDQPLSYDPILRYRVQYRPRGKEKWTQLVPAGELRIIPALKFATGPESHNYTLEILFTVLDKFGGTDERNTTIQVNPVVISKADLDDLFKEGGDIYTLQQSKDPEAGYRTVEAIASVVESGDLDEGEKIDIKDKLLDVVTNLSPLAKTSDSILQSADSYSSLYNQYPPPSKQKALNAATSLEEVTSNFADIKDNNADDVKRTGDALIGSFGNMIASNLPSLSPSTNSSSPSSTTMSPEEVQSDEDEERQTEEYESKMLSSMLLDVLEKVSDLILSTQVAGQDPAVTKTDTLEVRSQVNNPEDIGTGDIPIVLDGVQIGIPPAFDFFGEDIGQKLVAMKIIDFPDSNPYNYGGGSDDIGSGVCTVEFQTDNQNKLEVTNSPEPISLFLKTSRDAAEPVEIRANISQRLPMSYHRIDISEPYQDFRAVIESESVDGVWVFAKLGYSPINTSYDVVKRLPWTINGSESWDPSSAEEARNTFVLTKEEHCGNGTYFIGIMLAGTDEEFELLNSTTAKCSGEEARITLPNDENTTVISLTYNFSSYSSSCRFFSNTTDEWKTEGCRTGVQTTASLTHCLCNHLTSFAASFFVPPNKIDFSSVFDKNLLENFAVMGTIIAFASLYILLLIYARRKDRQDLIKWGVTPLSDNYPAHRYAYQVTVETGVRPGAGTKSKVGIMISGEDADTGVRVLDDPKRPIFQSGSINSFLMTVPRPLGLLTYVRIWHDNSGGGGTAGWFLSKVAVMDIQTGKEFFFLCEQWLAVEQGDGDVDRTLFVASKKDLTKVGQLVYTSGRKNLSDQHLWFSLFSRPTRSSFNRCQRLCCCITLLYTSMIANAMFYRAEATADNTQAIKIGSFTITPQQISIGFMSSLIVMPVNMIIAQIFRKARPLDPDAPDPLVALIRRCFTRKNKGDKVELFNFEEKRHDKAISEKQVEVNLGLDQPPADPSDDPAPPQTSAALAAKKKYPLPHWTIYIAYALAFVACFISCFFTVLYSLQWGKEKAEKWLGSMMTSFFSSAFVVQPAKVIVIVFIVSIIFKKPSKMDDADAEGLKDKTVNKLQTDEEYLHEDSLTAGTAPGYAIRPKTPPSKQILQEARKERLRDMQVSAVFKDCMLYSLFLVVVLFLAYTNRDPDSWNMSETIRNTFSYDSIDYLVDGEAPVTFSSLSQSTPDEYWNYIEQTLLPGLYGHKHYNGEDMNWRDARYLRDWQNYRVGPARLRQLRVKPLPCTVNSRMENAVKDCTLDYSWSNEDEGVFAANWTYTCDPSDEDIPNYAYYEVDETRPWRYQSAVDLYGVPYSSNLYIYGGGGFIAEFGINREQAMATAHYLRTHGWYDKYTRAIFIEFTVYNANINLFSVVTLLVETPTLGGGVPSTLVHTFRLYQYVGGLWIVSVAFQAIFCLYLLYFLGHFIYRLKKEGRKELKNIWMILEGSILLFGLSSAAMFIMRQIFIQFTLQEVKKKDEGGYVNFNHIAKWDQIYGYLLATLTFLAILRFMRVLRFSARVTHVAQALQRASKDMLYFLFMWCIIVVAFALWGYAVFSRSVFTFHTFQAVLESLLGMMIGSFDFYALSSVESVIGPIFFTLYIFAAYFMLANMLITIIVEAFCKSKAEPANESTFPIAKHMTTKFKMVMASYGIGSNSVGPAPNKQAANKKPEDKDKKDDEDDAEGDDPAYQDMMETIEKRVDQLITYVIKNYGDGKDNKPMGSKATLNTFEAMVKKDIETVKQRKVRNIMVT